MRQYPQPLSLCPSLSLSPLPLSLSISSLSLSSISLPLFCITLSLSLSLARSLSLSLSLSLPLPLSLSLDVQGFLWVVSASDDCKGEGVLGPFLGKLKGFLRTVRKQGMFRHPNSMYFGPKVITYIATPKPTRRQSEGQLMGFRL